MTGSRPADVRAGAGGSAGGGAGRGAGLPPEAFAAALAGLPGLGPGRLAALLRASPPEVAWARVLAGRAVAEPAVAAAARPDRAGVADTWRRAAAATDVARAWEEYRKAGVGVHVLGGAGYPAALAADPEPPAVLFSLGGPGVLTRRRVAIVGTRKCSQYGRDVARQLGRELAEAGVCVVSGLALGIDGAAHTGALEAGAAPPVAVVGSGLDVVYPRRHRDLWAEVARTGLLLSEAPLGTPPEAWRFPVRNRIIAALAEVVVVVESHARGGSRHTVDAAIARGRTVMAVPGSIRSSASSFANQLLAEGSPPVRDVVDVLVALGLQHSASGRPDDCRPPPGPDETAVLEALGWEPAGLEQLVARSGLGAARVSVALAHLECDGWVTGRSGWWEQVTSA